MMKITAELPALELIEKIDEEKDVTLKISCEGFESSEVILEMPEGRQFKLDANDLMEAVSRTAIEQYIMKKEDD